MEKRYQVFVSSTFRDLELERQEVMHALLELDCIPAGMELFPAANETQWNLIEKVIDDCDYYLLILGGRYGSIGPEGISYTEMEYRYALSTGKPTIAFLHRTPGKIIVDNSESSPDGKEKLQAFRTSVEKKLCKHWETPQELGSVVSRSLIQLIKSTPAVGWVRANELADREATMELLQLRRRVEDLQTELSRVRISAPKGSESLAQGDEEHTVDFYFSATPPGRYVSSRWSASFTPTWNNLFASIAPLMIHEAPEPALKNALDSFSEVENMERLREDDKLAHHSLGGFGISQDDFQTIKVQLRALGLITKNDKPRSVKDSDTYWTLTPYGDEIMTRLRAIRRDQDHTPISTEIIESEE
ncbi:MAG: hypothetical protein AW10_01279 [Candidatus Accumulibacter appositus]|uniref:DUF4062 domain-containing protein n=1 Tax=Candidatus Accumulibacter appositus TaxID=1454003 RepID=A0A011PWN2_9PROT|nr:DUF4062 domain-containing protein [Accumulibacter sp.]EXI81265.1 MAG: hypothetical protein AW10_01279 [Candidatus Accumulibacter appositus]HRF06163.1 DUF4062 domain-containing protein [Accumulibacter sp.]